jgi:hypothetical protein
MDPRTGRLDVSSGDSRVYDETPLWGGVVRTFSGAKPRWPAEKIPWSGDHHSAISFSTLAQGLDFPQNVQRFCLSPIFARQN